MDAGFEYHSGGAEESLGCEAGGDVAGEAGCDGAVAEGFNDLVAVGWSAAAEAGDGIEEGFRDLHGDAYGGEERLDGFGVGARGFGAERVGGGACADECRRIGHGADNADIGAQPGLELGESDACGDGDDEVFGGECGLELLGDGLDLCGFDGEDDGLGGIGEAEVIAAYPGTGGLGEGLDGVGRDIGSGDLVGLEDTGADESGGEGGGHLAGADETYWGWKRHWRCCSSIVWGKEGELCRGACCW